MKRSFGIVDAKVAEANYFLRCLDDAGDNFFKARCYFSAFISSARSITLAIQASLGDLPGFHDWYAEQQGILRLDPVARFFHEARRLDHHLGFNAVAGGEVSSGEDAPRIVYHFTSTGIKNPSPETDVVKAGREYLSILIALVFRCYERFGDLIGPETYYSAESFASRGLTIEDAEEEVFGVRGWTEVPGLQIADRWRLILSAVAPCNIDRLFEEYLGKRLPSNLTKRAT